MAEKSEDIEDMQSSLVSLDDFTHLSVDKYMTSSFTKSQYSQVCTAYIIKLKTLIHFKLFYLFIYFF